MPEFSSDVIHLTTPGYAFTDAIVPGQADEPLVVDFSVLVYSSTDYGVVSDMIDSTLVNHGYIFSRDAYGVIFDGGFDVHSQWLRRDNPQLRRRGDRGDQTVNSYSMTARS
jgi:hypothetical protein